MAFHPCYVCTSTPMSSLTRTAILAVVALAPLATGCASRAAPFDGLDAAQTTILKLGPQGAAAPVPGAAPGGFNLPIPGLTPEMQAQIQAGLGQLGQQAGGLIPPGLLPPGLIPTMPGTPAQQAPQFNGFAILGQQPVMEEDMKDDLLDLFGDSDSFSRTAGNCFTPGMGIVFQDPSMPNVEIMVSFSCNQAMGNGFRWPHETNGFTPETSEKLRVVYERLFGALPPQGV
jgi:hypothetical protein